MCSKLVDLYFDVGFFDLLGFVEYHVFVFSHVSDNRQISWSDQRSFPHVTYDLLSLSEKAIEYVEYEKPSFQATELSGCRDRGTKPENARKQRGGGVSTPWA